MYATLSAEPHPTGTSQGSSRRFVLVLSRHQLVPDRGSTSTTDGPTAVTSSDAYQRGSLSLCLSLSHCLYLSLYSPIASSICYLSGCSGGPSLFRTNVCTNKTHSHSHGIEGHHHSFIHSYINNRLSFVLRAAILWPVPFGGSTHQRTHTRAHCSRGKTGKSYAFGSLFFCSTCPVRFAPHTHSAKGKIRRVFVDLLLLQ